MKDELSKKRPRIEWFSLVYVAVLVLGILTQYLMGNF